MKMENDLEIAAGEAYEQQKLQRLFKEVEGMIMADIMHEQKALMETVNAEISVAVAVVAERQDEMIQRMLTLEAEVNKLKAAVANKKDKNSGGDYSELD